MFKASINAGNLKEAVNAVTRLVDEGKFRIKKEGMSLRAVDPADAAMVNLNLGLEAFNGYQFEGEDEGEDIDEEIGVDLERLEDILGVVSGGEEVSIQLSDGKIELSSDGLDYEMSLLDPSSIRKEPTIPDLDLKSEILMKGSDFRKAIRGTQKVSDQIVLSTENGNFIMEAYSDSDSITFNMREEDLVSLENEEDSRSLFSLDYLDDMSKAISKASEVRIRLGTDLPVKINFELAEGVDLEYLLAPRIESS